MDSLREELREHPQNKIKTTVVVPHLINTSADYMKYMNSRLVQLCYTKYYSSLKFILRLFYVSVIKQ